MYHLFALLLVAVSATSPPKHVAGGSTCAFCEFVVQTCEGFILNNSTEQHILNWLGTACALLPSPYNALCSQELTQYGPQVIEWIANKENPEVVCQQLHLCTNSTGVKVPVQVKKPQQNGCSVCELVVTFVDSYLQNNGTVAGVEAALETVCAVLPSTYSAECKAFIEQQLPALIQWIINNENPQTFCTQVGLCTSVTARLPVHTTTHKAQQSTCSICELVVTYVESYLNNNNTIAEVEAVIEGFSCNLLPSPWNAECNIFIDTYAPQLVQWIIQNETPQGFCTQVGLCASARLPVVHNVPVRANKALQSTCSICELVVTYVESYVANNATEAQIVQQLEAVCALLPSGTSALCNAFVEQYVPQLITWIENNENPQAFCTQVGLCTSVARIPKVHKALQSTCSICELVVTYVESYVANNATEAQIVQQLEAVCALLPSGTSALCNAFVEQYVPQLITWIENNENPQAFCTQVGLCTSVARIPKVHKTLQSTCSICELVVTYVESYVANNATEAQIVQQLESVCALLPSGTSALCNAFVEQYVPELITWIENNENPQAFCTQVGLCTSAKAPRRPTLKVKTF